MSVISTWGGRGLTSFIITVGSDRGKRPLQEQGPSGEQETDFILIEGDDTDMGPQSANLREIIKEKQADIDALSTNLDRAQWSIQYLEQRNKQLEHQQVVMELQDIRQNYQAAEGGGWSLLHWRKRSMQIGSHGSKELIST